MQAKDEQIRRLRALGDGYGDRVVAAEADAAQAAQQRTAAAEGRVLAIRERAAMAAELQRAVAEREDLTRSERSARSTSEQLMSSHQPAAFFQPNRSHQARLTTLPRSKTVPSQNTPAPRLRDMVNLTLYA